MTHRVQCIPTAAHVKLLVDGINVAETDRSLRVVEAGYPDRYYFPNTDVEQQHLTPTATQTHCPYKGNARYYTLTVNGAAYVDVAWHYDEPIAGVSELKDRIAFWVEKDARMQLVVDGVVVGAPG